MEYIIGLVFLIAICVAVFLHTNKAKKSSQETGDMQMVEPKSAALAEVQQNTNQLMIRLEQLSLEEIKDTDKLIEIKDEKLLARIDNLVPDLLQAGNAANNAIQANGEVLYQAIIPAGAKLANSRDMEGAVRGIYHGADGINGHANLVAVDNTASIATNIAASAMSVASMVVGQYYLTQISSDLNKVNKGLNRISNFQDKEYQSKVFTLVAQIQEIARFQVKILENEELRMSEIDNLNRWKKECVQLLEQACLMVEDFTNNQNLKYEEYESLLPEIEKWYTYQKILFEVLIHIAELKHALHLGSVSFEQCSATVITYGNQVKQAQEKLEKWHHAQAERLHIDVDHGMRKRVGFDSFMHLIPSWINEDNKYRSIAQSAVKRIQSQTSGYSRVESIDTIDLFREDVRIIGKEGRLYYLPPQHQE